MRSSMELYLEYVPSVRSVFASKPACSTA